MVTKVVWDRVLAVICAAILCGILLVGLWPLTPYPKNHVAWLESGNGLHFGHYGTILSADAFKPTDVEGGAPCSLEIWSKPGQIDDSNTMLAFYSPEKLVSFSLHQSTDDLLLQRQDRNRQGRVSEVHIYAHDVLRQGTAAFVTLTASAQGTAIYVDGALAKSSSHFGLSSRDFAGQLVVGNSPVANESWSGDLRGLTIYDRELTSTEVLEHFNSWTKKERPAISEKEGPAALYLFDERAGSVIHNRAGFAPDLYIPAHYLIVGQTLLEVPWKEYHPGWGYYKDVLINIGGFIPLGFVFCAYFSSALHLKRPQSITIFLGFAVSLTIEVLQGFIPTRASGLTDVVTNTLGTAIGAMVFQWKTTQKIFSRVGIPIEH
jgi:VanZ like family/Concanavalin A-like lectin/glucanases superfamily